MDRGATVQFTSAQSATPTPQAAAEAPKNNYADDKSWLCRPGRQDACAIDHTTTIVAADGKLTRETWTADANAPIDCFYVYPTISTDTTPYSDMNADPAELNVVRQQFARFASKCRVYAPLYRQVTLSALTRGLAPGSTPVPLDRGLGYDDVNDAWNHYLQNDNKGRGFVLVGHSQGSFVLAELIRQEIDGKPIQSRLVSAILAGRRSACLPAEMSADRFRRSRCASRRRRVGCVITFASFRSTMPPPANSLFGRPPAANLVGACTNPAALGGRQRRASRVSLQGGPDDYRHDAAQAVGRPGAADRHAVGERARALDRRCKTNENATYLEVTVTATPPTRAPTTSSATSAAPRGRPRTGDCTSST